MSLNASIILRVSGALGIALAVACSASPAAPDAVSVGAGGHRADAATAGTCSGKASLAVILTGSGSGAVSSVPAGLTCPTGGCAHNFPCGTEVTLTATPGRHSVLTGWTDACLAAGANLVATVTMDATKYCTVTFDKTTGPPPPSGGPDLIARFSQFPSRAKRNEIVYSGVETENQGNETAPASVTKVWFSMDGVLDTTDVELWRLDVPSLLPGVIFRKIGDADPVAFSVTLPSRMGRYYYFVQADVDGAVIEINESNNLRVYKVDVR